MYEVVMVAHSLVRWLVLLSGFGAAGLALHGWLTGGAWKPLHRKLNASFIGSMHLNVVLGLLLYLGLSPVVKAAHANMGVSMKDAVLRFWAVEHITLMILAAIVAHGAHVISKSRDEDKDRFKIAGIGFALAIVMVIAAIPWPFREALGRGLLPTFASM